MNKQCPIESTLSLINGKWRILILKILTKGPARYGAIEKKIPGISAKVLTQQLREMESDGLIIRTIFAEIPPRVEYRLSEMGVSIFSVVFALYNWGMTENKDNGVECSGCGDCIISPYYKQ
jgi:DNA-binding HxlR family transcriptional regulator